MDERLEKLKRVCKSCLKEDYRINMGSWGKDKRHVNLEGKTWLGNLCPACNVIRVRHRMRKLREEKANAKQQPQES